MENIDLSLCPHCGVQNSHYSDLLKIIESYKESITTYKNITEGYHKVANAHIEEVKHLHGVVNQLKSELAMKNLQELNDSIQKG